MKALLLVVLFVGGLQTVIAQDCYEQEEAKINFCLDQKFQNEDKRLNETYQELMHIAEKGERKRIRKAQRAWLLYMKRNCRLTEYLNRNTMQAGVRQGLECELNMTSAKANDLQEILDYKNGIN